MSLNLRQIALPIETNAARSRGDLCAPNLRVMVVEDHEDTRFMLKTVLEMKGHAVVEAGDGLEAVEIARRERPDLILLDGHLPLLDGISTARRIRQDARLREVPIVLLSGSASPDYQAAARAAGCTAYLLKPVDFEQFDNLLKQLLESPRDPA